MCADYVRVYSPDDGTSIIPAKNAIDLRSTNAVTVEIFNMKGNLISKQAFSGGVYNVSLGHLPKGLYIIKAYFGNSGKKVLKVPVR
ncbi:MAG: T9SS type A sorting domain-containing protein [Fibromonadales bacterium]|nr:T9SS type A sorting domain-containing protein [Fibromonadales bacterium]